MNFDGDGVRLSFLLCVTWCECCMLEGEVGRCGERDEERVGGRERCASPSAGLRAFLLEGEGGICGVLKDKDLNMVEVEGMGLGDVG